jgi:SAM-dependent methyltransferase
MPKGLSHAYYALYALISGERPYVRPWHFQWLTARALSRDMHALLPTIRGRLLDVGSRGKPYQRFVHPSVEHIGCDIEDSPGVDIVIDGVHIPCASNSFDAVLCTQVIHHADDADTLRDEMIRCLKPGGTLILSLPFVFGEHNAPHDYMRLSQFGVRRFLEPEVAVRDIRLAGGIGSALGGLLLNWCDTAASGNRVSRLLKWPALPLFLLLSLGVNMGGSLLDQFDATGHYYCNLVAVGSKRDES